MDNTTKWIVRISSIGILLVIGFFLFNIQQENIKYEKERKKINQEKAKNELIQRRRMAKINAERYCENDFIYLKLKGLTKEAERTWNAASGGKYAEEAKDIWRSSMRETIKHYDSCVKRKQKEYLR